MHITMSFADGSPARISSINTALRHFRPSFIHIWELKTFWHEKVICEDDVEASLSRFGIVLASPERASRRPRVRPTRHGGVPLALPRRDSAVQSVACVLFRATRCCPYQSAGC